MRSRTQMWLVVSVVWVAVWTGYAIYTQYLPDAKYIGPNEWGDFMAGVFGSLAFLWLVLGYYQQGEELQQNTEALKNQAEEIKNSNEALRLQVEEMQKSTEHAAAQAKSISENEKHARRDTFFRIAELHERDLNFHASSLISQIEDVQFALEQELNPTFSTFGERAREVFRPVHIVQVDGLWDEFSKGNTFIFTSNLSRILSEIDEVVVSGISKSNSCRTLIRRYCRVFEKIVDESTACDDGDVLKGEYEWCPHGEVYMLLCEKFERPLIDGFRGGRVRASLRSAPKEA